MDSKCSDWTLVLLVASDNYLAEREGFEPSDPLPSQLISSESHSAALAPLQRAYVHFINIAIAVC